LATNFKTGAGKYDAKALLWVTEAKKSVKAKKAFDDAAEAWGSSIGVNESCTGSVTSDATGKASDNACKAKCAAMVFTD